MEFEIRILYVPFSRFCYNGYYNGLLPSGILKPYFDRPGTNLAEPLDQRGMNALELKMDAVVQRPRSTPPAAVKQTENLFGQWGFQLRKSAIDYRLWAGFSFKKLVKHMVFDLWKTHLMGIVLKLKCGVFGLDYS